VHKFKFYLGVLIYLYNAGLAIEYKVVLPSARSPLPALACLYWSHGTRGCLMSCIYTCSQTYYRPLVSKTYWVLCIATKVVLPYVDMDLHFTYFNCDYCCNWL